MDNTKGYRKYILLVGDGMADYPLAELDGKTVLQVAKTPNMDRIAAGTLGLVKTIPDGMDPGSDVAALSLLGYDPSLYHTGRAPLEAASLGVSLAKNDVAFRMNLITLDKRSDDEIIMVSHSSGDITKDEGNQVVESLRHELESPGKAIYPGVAYRHLLVWKDGPEEVQTIPPHDVLGQNMASYLRDDNGNPIPAIIRSSWEILEGHPVNGQRRSAGKKEANSIWLWGQGRAPDLPRFLDLFNLSGGVISAVDLLKGIGIYAGFHPIHVEGATGFLDTNYRGKAENALKGLETLDLVFVHVEAPDEASHNGSIEEKRQAIEDFDEKVVGTILEGLSSFADYRIMAVSDHLTPIVKRTHTADPTPFAWASKAQLERNQSVARFSEEAACESGLHFEKGYELITSFLSDNIPHP
jgi:2,3-bisphosphoglycerate-independent phosphoglycerate mutase